LLQSRNSFHQRFRKCRRCGDVTSRRVRDVARHAAFCSKFSVEQRRRGIGTELRFRHHKYQSQKTIIEKLRSLSINIGVEFSELKSACVFDCESYQTKLTSGGDKRMARYSDSFGFGSRQRLAMIVCSYKYARNREGVRTFYVADSGSAKATVREFIQFLLKIAERNANSLHRHRFAKIFGQLDYMEEANKRNGFMVKRIRKARDDLHAFIGCYTLIGWNSGNYDMEV
ncbi:MAG: hypothetical protein GY820_02735, partial [Gammaproteobacteria bacterium]|nr:hypothetical protein [Gammaproteobacteria bacterium]